MLLSARLSPPNSVVFLHDSESLRVPQLPAGQLVGANDDCVMIGCLCELDGQTEFVLGDLTDMREATAIVHDGVLMSPSRRIVLSSAINEIILEFPVSSPKVGVRVWANHPTEPDRIAIGIEPRA